MRFWTLLALCGLLVAGQVLASQFEEGVHYDVVFPAVPTEVSPGKVEVLELFWYGCPHCYHLEPEIDRWLAKKPDKVDFRRMPGTLNPSWLVHAKTYYALETLGVVDAIHPRLFKALHEQGRRLRDPDSIARFLGQQGVDPQAFLDAYHSMGVQTKTRHAQQRGSEYGANGVPTIIVNGKYRTSASMAGGNPEIFEVVDYLVGLESGSADAGGN